jgi:DNA-binding transcriptional LysR family regulator
VREENSGTRHCLEAALRKKGSSLADMQIVMEANSNDAIVAAVRRGSGAAFMSTALVHGHVRDGQVSMIKVRALRPRRSLYLISHAQRDGREPLASFVNFVRESAL